MAGTNAYAVIGETGTRRARVLDLGFGGVALEFEQAEDFPENLLAVLHVPILPPVRVFLRPVWSRTDQRRRLPPWMSFRFLIETLPLSLAGFFFSSFRFPLLTSRYSSRLADSPAYNHLSF